MYPRNEQKNVTDPLLPKAMSNPFHRCPPQNSDTDYSQMIHEKAIQYLNYPQRTLTPEKTYSDQANYTRYGLPDNNISIATKQFLSKNRLID